jgi:hypothetical protein
MESDIGQSETVRITLENLIVKQVSKVDERPEESCIRKVFYIILHRQELFYIAHISYVIIISDEKVVIPYKLIFYRVKIYDKVEQYENCYDYYVALFLKVHLLNLTNQYLKINL